MDLINEIISKDLKTYLATIEDHKFTGHMTLCPFHDDHVESMSVDRKNDSDVWYCHKCKAGGNIIHYIMKKYILDKKDAIKKLAQHYGIVEKNCEKKKVVSEYPYLDEKGEELYRVVRFQPKDFRCKHKVGEEWKWTKQGIRPVLYNLPRILKHGTVWLVEGEKDCESLRELGLVATTNPFGVGSWKSEFAQFLKGKVIYICLDRGCEDESQKRAKEIARRAKEVKIIDLPGLDKDGLDITDWINIQGDLEPKHIRQKLVDIALTSPVFTDTTNNLIINNEFLNDYCENISQSTDAPRIFILFSGLALLSGILSKFCFYYPTETHLNLYILLLAPSTFYRKTICLDIASDYMKKVNENLCLPESFTPEALFSILSEQNRGTIFWREFNQVKEFQFGKEYNKGLSELLTDVYDFKKIWKRKIKAEPLIELHEPIISILSAGVTSWFTEKLRDIDFQGGLWTRFLFIAADEEKRTYHWPSKFVLNPAVLAELRKLDALEAGEINFSEVKEEIIQWGTEHMEKAQNLDSEIFRATYLRLEVMLLKIAALLQLSQNLSPVIKPETFKEAVGIIEYLKARLETFFREEIHFGQEEKNRAGVVRYLKKRKEVTYRTLLQGVRVKADDLRKVLNQLKDEGLVIWNHPQIKWLG